MMRIGREKEQARERERDKERKKGETGNMDRRNSDIPGKACCPV